MAYYLCPVDGNALRFPREFPSEDYRPGILTFIRKGTMPDSISIRSVYRNSDEMETLSVRVGSPDLPIYRAVVKDLDYGEFLFLSFPLKLRYSGTSNKVASSSELWALSPLNISVFERAAHEGFYFVGDVDEDGASWQ